MMVAWQQVGVRNYFNIYRAEYREINKIKKASFI